MAAEPFRIVEDEETEPAPPKTSTADTIGIEALRIGLSALSQRALVALSRLFTLLTVASAFTLWWRVLPDPSVFQLVGLSIYAAFVLTANLIVKRG